MSLGSPVAIATSVIFGYVFDDDGVTPIENAEITFKSDSFQIDDNAIKIDEVALSDATGLYQATLPQTDVVGELVYIEIRWTDLDGIEHLKEERIIVGTTSPQSVQEARAETTPTKVITGGPQGPTGPQGPQGPQGLPGGALPSFNISGGGTQQGLTPGYYFVDSSAGATILEIPNASVGTEDSEYKIFKDDSSANTVTVTTVGGIQLIGAGTSQVISLEDQGLSLLDQSTKYEIIQDSRFAAGSSIQSVGTANSAGTANDFSRSDHVHNHGAQTDPTHHAAAIAGGNAGFMSGADKTKIDSVESGATADQTGAEIKAAYEAELDTNAFTDAEQTKLAGIEAGATADQTPAEIKAAYEANLDTNVFDDAAQTKLAGIEASADVTDETNVTDALDGAVLVSAAPVQGNDKVLVQDTSDTDILKTVTAQSIANLADGGTKYLWFSFGADTTNHNGYATRAGGATASANYVSFFIPADFNALVSIDVFFIPNAGLTNVDIDLYSNYAAENQNSQFNQESDLASVYTRQANQMESIDVSGVFTGIAADDFCGLQLDHNSIGTTNDYIGLRLVYTT